MNETISDMQTNKHSIKTKYLKIFSLAFISCMMPAVETPAAEKTDSAYLFVYFTGNTPAEEAVRFAVSRDGFNYTALNGNLPVIDSGKISETGGVRDPHIYRGPDNRFYMTLTDMTSEKGWDSNRGMVLLTSDSLVDWKHSTVNIQKRFPGQEDLKRVWAPQSIFDPETGNMLVYWSMKYGDNGTDIIYYAYTNKDFTDFITEPKVFFTPDDGKSCIDGDIIVDKNGKYHLFYKTEGHGNGIRTAVAESLTRNNWKEKDGYMQQTTDAVEGAGTFKLIGEDKYILMYDVYMKGRYQFCESDDLENFKAVDENVTMNFHPRHGTIIAISNDEYTRLLNKWK